MLKDYCERSRDNNSKNYKSQNKNKLGPTYPIEVYSAKYCVVCYVWHQPKPGRALRSRLFAGGRPDYTWASTAGASVLAYTFQKADKVDTQVRSLMNKPND